MFYAKSTGGFYVHEIHNNIPSDAVEITDEQHVMLITGNANGKLIVGDENGYPILVDPIDTRTYAEKRRSEYPPYADYLDGVVKGDQDQIAKYIADCQAVKAKYPKV